MTDCPDIIVYGIMIIAGVICGFLNTVAGGGSFISIPLLIFFGLSGSVANATNRLSVMAQGLFSAKGFKSKNITLPLPYSYYLSFVSLVGGLIGTKLALSIPDSEFNRIMSVVMLIAVIFIVFPSTIKDASEKTEKMSVLRQIIGTIIFFLLGIYGGFLQAGIGFLSIASLSFLHGFNMVKINYIKVFVSLLYTGASIAIFIFEGKIFWSIGIALAIGHGVGGWYASRWSVERGEKWIKIILAIVVIPIALKLWFF